MSHPRVNINFFAIFGVIAELENQLTKALEDGKITGSEAMEMAMTICKVLSIEIKD